MSLYVAPDRLLDALGILLHQRVLPTVECPALRSYIEHAVGAVARSAANPGSGESAREVRGNAQIIAEVREILDRSSGERQRLDRSEVARLEAALAQDQAQRSQAIEHSKAKFRAYRDGTAYSFAPPTQDKLTGFLRSRRPSDPDIRADNVKIVAGGYSKQTILFDAVNGSQATETLVMRRDQPKSPFGTTVAREFPVLSALYRVGYPVPEPLWFERSDASIPGSLMVSRKVPGEPAGDPKGVKPHMQSRAPMLLADMLARLHSIDPTKLGAEGISDQRWDLAALSASIGNWKQFYRSAGAPVVAADLAFRWLRDHCELGLQRAAIVHGDAGYHNLLVAESAVLLDWEMVHLGSAVEDLCGIRNQVEQTWNFDEFIEEYVRRGGQRPAAAALEFYDVFRLARAAAIFATSIQSFSNGDSNDLAMVNFTCAMFNSYINQLHEKMKSMLLAGGLN